MLGLDFKTVSLICLAASAASALFLAALWQQNRQQVRGLSLWALHFALQTAALGLALFAPQGNARWLIDVAVMAAWFALYAGFYRFLHDGALRRRDLTLFVIASAVMVALAQNWPSQLGHSVAEAVFSLAVSAQIMWLLLARSRRSQRASVVEVLVALAGYALLAVFELGCCMPSLGLQQGDGQEAITFGWVMGARVLLVALLTQALVLVVTRRLNQAMASERAKFARAFEAAPFAMVLSRMPGNLVVDVNTNFEAFVGLGRGQALGATVDSLDPWRDPQQRDAAHQAMAQSGHIAALEAEFQTSKGAKWGLFSAQAYEADGATYVMSCIADITEKKQAEQALLAAMAERDAERAAARTSEEIQHLKTLELLDDAVAARTRAEQALAEADRLRAALDRVPAHIYIKDAQSRYVYANRPTLELFGCTAPELIGKGDDCFFTAETAARLRDIDQRIFAGETTSDDVTTAEVNGTARVFWEIKAPIYDPADPTRIWGLTGVSTDVTEQRQIGEQQALYVKRAEALLALPEAAERLGERELLQFAIDKAEELTSSRIAFAHLVHEDQATVELVTWSHATLASYCTAVSDGHYPLATAGIWADAAREQRAIIVNDYAGLASKSGLPDGHAELLRFLTVPVSDGGLARMLVGVGNSAKPYTNIDVETVQLLANAAWRIVRQRRGDAALQEQQKLLAQAQAVAQMGSWTVELATGKEVWSDETRRLYYLAPEEPAPDWPDMLQLLHPDDRAAMAQWADECVAGKQPPGLEFRTNPDRWPVRWLVGQSTRVCDAAGLPLRLFGTVQDITEAKVAREKIDQLARIYATLSACSRAVMHSSSEGEVFEQVCRDLVSIGAMSMAWVGMLGEDGRRIEIVASAGRHAERVAAANLTTEPGSPSSSVPTVRAIAEQQPYWCHDFQLDPNTVLCRQLVANCAWQSSASLPLRRGGAVVGAISVYADVKGAFDAETQALLLEMAGEIDYALDHLASERMRIASENQLHKLSQAVEQSSEAIVITDMEARIEYVNPAFERVTGYQRSEVVGQNPRILQSGRTPRATYDSMWQAMLEGRGWKGEFINKRKDGSEFNEFSILSPLRTADGTVSHYVAVKEDITERKRVGAELDAYRNRLEQLVASRTADLEAARQQAESANLAKSAFLANMSHEIRTPMNAVLGLTHLLQRSNPTAEQRERLDRISDSGRHLLSIINDILDLSKIESGHFVLEASDFPLAAVLDHVASLVGETAHAKGLRLVVDRDGMPMWLHGDATRLRQALLNYAGNAVKFSDHGVVTLRAKVLQQVADDLTVRFEVEDQGIGISPEQQARLFRTFEQADASTTRKFGGTGLGLAIVKRIATAMGGEVGVTSALGHGSTFWLTCRLQRGKPSDVAVEQTPRELEEVESALRELYQQARLLLVEDHPVNRDVAMNLLRGAGLSVDVAEDGVEAVKLAESVAYDLILMDVQMPKMNGLDATRAIHALPGRQNTPIVAMTANAFDEDRRACEAAGMCDFVAKPVEPAALFATLLRWLRARHPMAVRQQNFTPRAMQLDHVKTPLPQPLVHAAGLDTQRGLVAVSGDGAAYAAILRQFTVAHARDCQLLRAELAAGDQLAAAQRVHALKGVSGTLGATQIHHAAVAIETALRDGDTEWLGGLVDTLGDAIEALTATLREVTPQTEVVNVPADIHKAMRVLQQLSTQLANDDTVAVELFARHRALLMATYGNAASALGIQVAAFDFPAALALAQTMLASGQTS